ncbi:amyloid beta precursor protein (cytoplasmic tail) Hypothetical protein protein 2 [Nesidiocoris tenuis]|uniref:Amyloid protein-binding protein 2 n=1 Tax=Nesidiocoris tenuis TaxID=355587 RepID=A0ABN7AVZ2_9HEMI|nr:amyloid beta precursor protein (cytoplasmic tail) Hypothetical protein protein 2 [Nesidiocoris tenuis]
MSSQSPVVRSMYEHSVSAVAEYFTYFRRDLRELPETVLFDVYMKLFAENKLCILGVEFSDLNIFSRLLKINNSRVMLIKCFQALQCHGTRLAYDLAQSYNIKASYCQDKYSSKDSAIEIGIRLGGFLIDTGWFMESIMVLRKCRELCFSLPDNLPAWKKILDCCHKLLLAESSYSQFEGAAVTRKEVEETVEKVKKTDENMCFAAVYTQLSVHSFYLSNYRDAHNWSIEAVQQLTPNTCKRVTVETLSQAAKACVMKRELRLAEALIRLAVYTAAETFGTFHPKYAEALTEYGYYLLNSDSTRDSVVVYKRALKLKKAVFGEKNLHVAAMKEDLAYALYVHEYASGRFNTANHHATQAIETLTKLLPEEHLMLASAHRVKALILEEIALDHMSQFMETQSKLLSEAEKLHQNALRLCLAAFGEYNVQTAKHYGNLGRLYQSMKRYQEAEQMHLKAIEIKECLLGMDDYEVGLSVGHLASLYNFHMEEYRKAETLYFRSINISLKLFSEAYSGLEYDYRGLIHVYTHLNQMDNAEGYLRIIEQWKRLRQQEVNKDRPPLEHSPPVYTLSQIQGSLEAMKKGLPHPFV